MPISANTLFHFTRDFETLIKILQSKFLPRLCLEDSIMPRAIPLKLAVPMVCFCDIPLSQVSEHTSKYGRYAIGIQKEWAMKQGVTPVLYVHEDSLIPNTIISELQSLSASIQRQKDPDYSKIMRFIDAVCMMKRYSGFDERAGKEVCYYDEREWRYVPKRETNDQFCYLIESLYNQESIRSKVNKENEKYGLEFNPDVINYLIVDKEQEILTLQRLVKEIKGRFSHNSVELLSTRILSMERVQQDM